MRLVSYLATLLALVTGGFAQDLAVSLIPPASAVEPGASIDVVISVANASANEAGFPVPSVLNGTLFAGERAWPVELHPVARPSTVTIPPRGFAQVSYRLSVPSELNGRVVLEIQRPATILRTALLVESNAPSEPKRTLEAPLTPLLKTSIVAGAQRSFFERFALHDPMYLIFGPDDPVAKFQFSFKYRLLSFGDWANSPQQRSLQFGYTQRSLWDIASESSPFYDTSYMPSLFYQSFVNSPAGRPGATKYWVGYQAGYQHESNGQGGTGTRSTDHFFVRPVFLFGPADRWHLIFAPRIFAYLGKLPGSNPDLDDFRGYGEWQFIFGRNNGPSLTYTGRAGKDFDHLTTQLDLALPLRTKLLDFSAYFLVQYFEGYGESLRDYNRASETVRAGISLVR